MSKLCFNCFKPTDSESNVCPYCGFHFKSYHINDRVLPPETVLNGKYTIGRTLGEGGFGITYLAWDMNMQTRIAIKEYYPGNIALRDTSKYGGNTLHVSSGTQNEEFDVGLKRYVKEAAILSRFSNLEGIVSVRDFFYENGTAYIVMEYVEGISLKDYLRDKDGKVTINEALNIMEPIIKSLIVIHKNKLLHRDISPDNIMISRDGKVKLIDFGAARYFVDDYDKSMTVVLKQGYAPIEQYSKKGDQGEWTDVYALCAVLYRMITGLVPDASTERISHDTLIPVRKIEKKTPKHIAAAIEKGLSVKLENRQQDMQELYSEMYLTEDELHEQRKDKATAVIIKMLVVLIVLFVIVGEVALMSYIKSGKIKDGSDRQNVIASGSVSGNAPAEEQDDDTEPESIDMTKVTQSKPDQDEKPALQNSDVHQQDRANRDGNDNRHSAESVETEQNQPVLPIIKTHEEVQQQNADDELQYAVIVVRDGYLNGKSTDYTVGGILDAYSDSAGSWYGSSVSGGTYHIYYQGTKNGESFVIGFEVYQNDTFKLTDAAVNNVSVENYPEYFQQILNEVGV